MVALVEDDGLHRSIELHLLQLVNRQSIGWGCVTEHKVLDQVPLVVLVIDSDVDFRLT